MPRLATRSPWEELERADGVYFVSGDAELLRSARRARVLVATARELPTIAEAGVELDALVGSANDVGETFKPGDVDPPPKLAVWTSGARGRLVEPGRAVLGRAAPGAGRGRLRLRRRLRGGPHVRAAARRRPRDAIALAARCGAAALTGRGAYAGQLRLDAADAGSAPQRSRREYARLAAMWDAGRHVGLGGAKWGKRGPMLLGEFEHSIDDKNRLTLPARFRQALRGGVVVTRGIDGCLYAYAREDWERLVESRLARSTRSAARRA